MVSTKRISAAVLPALKDALTRAFWYKPDLRSYLDGTLSCHDLIARLDWSKYKWMVVAQLVDTLAADQHKYYDDLLNLILITSEIEDPSHLRRVEDGQRKHSEAVEALAALRKQTEPLRNRRSQEEQAGLRRDAERARAAVQRAIEERLSDLRQLLRDLVSKPAQERGYSLEKLLNELFAVFDIDAKGPFRIAGEQIDGAFTHQGNEFLLEAKWQAAPTPGTELSIFGDKVRRKLDNTLGLFLSMNGFQPTAIELHSQGRPVMVLMDGSDLSLVLEGRIPFPELLTRKRQHAARTGEIYLRAFDLL